MKFFTNCKNSNEAKELFRKLSKCFHPDVGGESDLMIELRKQYESFGRNNYDDIPNGNSTPYSYPYGQEYSYNPQKEIMQQEINRLRNIIAKDVYANKCKRLENQLIDIRILYSATDAELERQKQNNERLEEALEKALEECEEVKSKIEKMLSEEERPHSMIGQACNFIRNICSKEYT